MLSRRQTERHGHGYILVDTVVMKIWKNWYMYNMDIEKIKYKYECMHTNPCAQYRYDRYKGKANKKIIGY